MVINLLANKYITNQQQQQGNYIFPISGKYQFLVEYTNKIIIKRELFPVEAICTDVLS